MPRIVLILLLVVSAAAAWAKQGKYPITGIPRSDPAVAVTVTDSSGGCFFGSANFPCEF